MPAESLARAAAVADLVLVEGVAACPTRILAPIGSHVVAAVARSLERAGVVHARHRAPVAGGVRRRDRRPGASPTPIRWDLDLDDLPVQLVTHVASVDGVTDDVPHGLRPECAFVPELLRVSPI